MWAVWVIAYYCVQNDYVVPSFSATLVSLAECLASQSFWQAFANTLIRTVIAFIISFALAAVCAALSKLSKIFKGILTPVLIFLRTLPTLAVVLILLIWTTPKVAPVVITFLVLFPMMCSQLSAAIDGVDNGLIEMAEVFKISKRERLCKIYLPQVSESVFSQAGANMSLGLKIMVSAEVIANTAQSLGGSMSYARSFLEIPRLAALTLLTVAAGFIFELVLCQLTRINKKWRGGNEN
jgi:NitT/TauT family transport system permease protein